MDLPIEGLDFVSHQALNVLATEVAGSGDAAVVLAGSHILGKEIQRRLKGCEVVWMPADGFRPPSSKIYWLSKLQKWVGAGNNRAGGSGAVILACPLGEGHQDGCGEILVELPSQHSLHVLAYGQLSWLTPEWQFLRTSLSSLRRARLGIRRAGWVVEEERGIYGLGSAIWAYAAKCWAYLRQEDLADRCYHAMREGLANGSGRAGLAALVLMRARYSLRGGQLPSTNRNTNTRM